MALAMVGLLLLCACGERDSAPARADAARAPAAPVAAPRIDLKDVLETTPTHIVGISYPKELGKYPGLAAHARRYADDARQQLLAAVRERPSDPAQGPYELSLEFKLKHESPEIVVLAVDGSSFTGGAHGLPMINRWVWLPPENRLLTANALFPRPESWSTISTGVRTQLRGALSRRLEADGVPSAQRATAERDAVAMIDGGTEPRPEDFAVFEPVMTPDGKIGALRFVFPPYQVGTYADGMHTVELPAAQLVQYVDPAYRDLFAVA